MCEVGFAEVIWEGVQDEFYCVVMTQLGPNLLQLFRFCERKFSMKTILLVAM